MLGLVASLGACEPDLDTLLSGNTSGGGGPGGASASSSGTGTPSTGGAPSMSSTTADVSTSTTGSTSSSTASSSTASSSSTGTPDAGPVFAFTFDTGVDNWTGRTYAVDDAGTALPNPTIAYSSTLGHKDAGAVEGTMTFTAGGQAGLIRFVPTPKPDFTGRTMTSWAYVESTTGTIQISAFAQGGPNVTFVFGPQVTVDPGAAPMWIPLNITIPAASASWDPTAINQFGVQLYETLDKGTAGPAKVAVDDVTVK